MRRVLRCMLTMALAAALLAPTASAAQVKPEVQRLSGTSRFDTAAEISSATFSPPMQRVWVATGEAFADALAAGAAAAGDGGPVLLTGRGFLPDATRAELERLQPAQVAVVGGPGAVSTAVEQQIGELLPDADVVRVAGRDRFVTAARVAETAFPEAPATVYVATGEAFPDALAAVPAAAAEAAPLLLVGRTTVPAATRAYLETSSPASVVVVGGSGAVSEEVAEELAQVSGGALTRVAGRDRFATAVALLARTGGAQADHVVVTSGETFPDALAGGPAAAATGTGIVLTGRTRLPQATRDAVIAGSFQRVTVLGGPSAVSESVAAALADPEQPLSLRGDGLGEGLAIGTPMDQVLERLTAQLGEPQDDSGWNVWCEFAGPDQARHVTWEDSLTVTFVDPGDPRLEAYLYRRTQDGTDALGLATPAGITLDSTSEEIGRAYGDRAEYHDAQRSPFGPFWTVEPAEGGHQAFFVEDDRPTARVVLLGANMRFCE